MYMYVYVPSPLIYEYQINIEHASIFAIHNSNIYTRLRRGQYVITERLVLVKNYNNDTLIHG